MSFGARDRVFRENREYKEFSDAPIPKFTKLTNFTKKTNREIATSLSALAMTIHKLL